MSKSYELPWTVPPHIKEAIRVGVWNTSDGALDVSCIVNAGSDTDYHYTITVERTDGTRMTKTQQIWFKAFCEGIICALR